jgi:hypothetical protein
VNKPCEYCGCDLPMGIDKATRRTRSFHFQRCEKRLQNVLYGPGTGETDPFADIRDKRIGELNPEQFDRATELWLREQIGPSETYWHPHLQSLFRVIDRLRADQ